jgi:hypothetical protein
MATITSVFKLSMFSDRSLVVAFRSAEVAAAFLREFKLASSSSRAVLSSFTAELTAAKSDSLAAVALRESKLDCRSLFTLFSASRSESRAESKTATSMVVAVVTLRESKLFCMLSIVVFNEFMSEFRAVMFASISSSLALSASISATMSSRVAGSANTVKAFDDTVAAEIMDAIMNATKILDNILLCIFVSPNLMHLQSVDMEYTSYVHTSRLKKFVYKPKLVPMCTRKVYKNPSSYTKLCSRQNIKL